MKIFHHRINDSKSLNQIPSTDGIEIDLRTLEGQIILQHEPFLEGENFKSWLQMWNGQEIILNIKEEGLEEIILEILEVFNVKNYFFLDQSFPFVVKTLRTGNKNIAVRVSDIESIETALALECNWVWLDCFSGDWRYLLDVVPVLSSQGKRTCLVSPELVRSNSGFEVSELQNMLLMHDIRIDAVCTKNKSSWENYDS
jgi:hypothetical protein